MAERTRGRQYMGLRFSAPGMRTLMRDSRVTVALDRWTALHHCAPHLDGSQAGTKYRPVHVEEHDSARGAHFIST